MQNAIGLPVEIYHHAFAHFLAVSRDESLEPPQDVLDSTIKLMDASSQIVTGELDRQSTTLRLLTETTNPTVMQTVLQNEALSDHIICYTRKGLGAAALVVIEEKAEPDTSGEGSVQGSFSYLQHWTDNERKVCPVLLSFIRFLYPSNLQDLVAASCCASFIVSIAGPWLVVLGAVLTSNAITHRLTDYLWLGNSRVIDDATTKRLARIFTALCQSVAELKSFYEKLSPPSDPNARFFPLARSYIDHHSL